MFQLAVYGKGGIGKSTLSANLSVALAGRGYKVMQVGCDPKHDSTRLLLGGRSQQTVLEYVRKVPVGRRRLDDIIEEGTGGVLCAEAGGPEPGIGCAGRGILTTFDTLKRLGADDIESDFRIYDVLGDVVCGGFAVPLRSEYADAVILVTSGEFMSMYAANNIMRGMRNFDSGRPRLLGLVLNSRGVQGEVESVRAFAEATGCEVLAVLPRDPLFADAESKGHTVRELYPDSAISSQLEKVVDRIESVWKGDSCAVTPTPLDDDQLSDLAAGRPIRVHGGTVTERSHVCCEGCGGKRTSIRDGRTMGSCSAYGAMAAFSRINDVAVILHGPQSCMYIMDTTRAKVVVEGYQHGVYDVPFGHNLFCTMLDDSASIFGGVDKLEETLKDVASRGFRDVAVITTCMPGIIGDDCRTVVDRVSVDHPDVTFHLVPADGDMTGDYVDGFCIAIERILDMVDLDVEPDPGYVNLIDSSFFDLSNKRNSNELDRILSRFGLKVNCRLLSECTSGSIRMLRRGSIDIPLSDTASNRELSRMVADRLGREPFSHPLPYGLYDFEEWVDSLGTVTGKEVAARMIIDEAESMYGRFMDSHAHRFAGKKVMIVSGMAYNVDWIIDVLNDLGAEVVRVGIVTGSRRKHSAHVSRYPELITSEYTMEDMDHDVEELRPHLVIGDVPRPMGHGIRFARIVKMGFGVHASLSYALYLENMMRLPIDEGWKEGKEV